MARFRYSAFPMSWLLADCAHQYAKRVGAGDDSAAPPCLPNGYLVKIEIKTLQIEIQTLLASRKTMGDYGWSMDSDTPQGIDAVEYGRVLEYPYFYLRTSAGTAARRCFGALLSKRLIKLKSFFKDFTSVPGPPFFHKVGN